jgi:hypothetical protein
MAETTYDIKKSLYKETLDAYVAQYKDITETWKSLETKAQGTVTIAGIFIASAFVFIKDIRTSNLIFNQRLLLVAAVSCLILSVIFAILALTLRSIASPPGGERISLIVKDILRLNEGETAETHAAALPDLRLSLFNEQIRDWKKAIDSANETIEFKVGWLWWAQWLLVLAIGCVIGLTFWIILG